MRPRQSKVQASVLHATLEKDELVLEWRSGTVGGTTTRRALSEPDLGGLFCAQWREHGLHHDMGDPARDELVLHAGGAPDFDALVPILVAADSCSRGGPDGIVPAFLVSLRRARTPVGSSPAAVSDLALVAPCFPGG